MVDLAPVLEDLIAETAELDALVSPLADKDWATPTPAPGWTIAHQIAHLAWTDDAAVLAVTEPEQFRAELQHALTTENVVDTAAAEGAAQPPADLLARWRSGRTRLAAALRAAPADGRIVWFGPPMTAPSMATARLMETWAHGQDVAGALGVTPQPTARLRHVAHLGVRTRDYAFQVHGMPAPSEPFRVALEAPDGSTWTWGPPDAAQRVTGRALDFCLLATQRAHRDDLALIATGADADAWLSVAQAFAGAPGAGREPGQLTG